MEKEKSAYKQQESTDKIVLEWYKKVHCQTWPPSLVFLKMIQ